MLIIVEGMRGVGKTTIIKELQIKLQARKDFKDVDIIRWKTIRGNVPALEMMKSLYTTFSQYGSIWLVDRFHLTEYVASAVLKRKDIKALLLETTFLIDSIYDIGGKCFVVQCLETTRQDRVEARGINNDDLPVSQSYKEWGNILELALGDVLINEGVGGVEVCVSMIEKYIVNNFDSER